LRLTIARAAEQPATAARCSSHGGVALPLQGEDMPHVENDHIVESATEARAAVTGHNVRYVLLISTLAVIVLFAVAYFVVRG
jgi:hypothetical protein